MPTQSIFAFLHDEADQEIVAEVARKRNYAADIQTGGIAEAVEVADSWHVLPNFLLLDTSMSNDPFTDIEAFAENAPDGEAPVIIVGNINDARFARRLTRMGIADYLVHPLSTEELEDSIHQIESARINQEAEIDPARLTCVHSVTGGAGSSTIAATLAQASAHTKKHNNNTFLIDFDIVGGIQHLLTGADLAEGFLGMFDSPQRIDAAYMQRVTSKASRCLSVLSSYRSDGEIEVVPGCAESIVAQAQHGNDLVVADLPARAHIGRDLLLRAGNVYLVAPPTVVGLRETINALNFLSNNNFDGKVVIVVNKVGEHPSTENNASYFRARLPHKVLELPYEIRAARNLLVSAQPLFSATSRISRHADAMAAELSTAPSGQAKKPRSIINLSRKRSSNQTSQEPPGAKQSKQNAYQTKDRDFVLDDDQQDSSSVETKPSKTITSDSTASNTEETATSFSARSNILRSIFGVTGILVALASLFAPTIGLYVAWTALSLATIATLSGDRLFAMITLLISIFGAVIMTPSLNNVFTSLSNGIISVNTIFPVLGMSIFAIAPFGGIVINRKRTKAK